MDEYIEYTKGIIDKIDGHAGYAYLDTASSKLKTNRDKLQDYVDFVNDSNASFVDLYNELVAQIASLNFSDGICESESITKAKKVGKD